MTRENKLSIVIAFGLLIFVGMLVADHFSIASHREVANLGSNISLPPIAGTSVLEGGPPPSSTQHQENKSGDTVHTVQQGETLRTICSIYYGDSGLSSAVAQWNRLDNPNTIENGQQIALPNRTALIAASFTDPQPSTKTNSSKTTMGKYTVKSGDTLSEISQKVMGTSKKTQVLIELNKDVMPNPDRIRPGMILQFPLPTSKRWLAN
jgi:nucleoid-associated protein YgaU